MKIVAVLLAAGEGRRMGGPKALLPWGDTTFAAHGARLLSRPGVSAIVVVLGHDAARVRREAALPPEARIVVNTDHAGGGMLSSILQGVREAEQVGAEAALVHPVDHPFVAATTIDRVVGAVQQGARIAVPSYEGRRGHPVAFSRAVWPGLRALSADVGARALLRGAPGDVVHVDGDAGCLAGVNDAADWERWRDILPQ